MILTWLILLVALTLFMALAWLVQWRAGNAGWVDVFWTFGTGLGGVAAAALPLGGDPGRRLLVGIMIGLWSLRLGGHIAWRVAHSAREDVRYARFRREWGAGFQRRMAGFVIIQGPIAAVLAGAVLLAAQSRAPFPGLLDILGLAVFLAAAGLEALADRQMQRFRETAPPGSVCDRGLWSLSRHPNYLGEFLLWCAFPVVALSGGPWSALAFFAPLMIYVLLVHISGIPPLEREMMASRPAAFRAYRARVTAFIPGLRIGEPRDPETGTESAERP